MASQRSRVVAYIVFWEKDWLKSILMCKKIPHGTVYHYIQNFLLTHILWSVCCSVDDTTLVAKKCAVQYSTSTVPPYSSKSMGGQRAERNEWQPKDIKWQQQRSSSLSFLYITSLYFHGKMKENDEKEENVPLKGCPIRQTYSSKEWETRNTKHMHVITLVFYLVGGKWLAKPHIVGSEQYCTWSCYNS